MSNAIGKFVNKDNFNRDDLLKELNNLHSNSLVSSFAIMLAFKIEDQIMKGVLNKRDLVYMYDSLRYDGSIWMFFSKYNRILLWGRYHFGNK